MEECILCGKKFKRLTHTHLKQAHNVTKDEYAELLEEHLKDTENAAMETAAEEAKVPQGTILGSLIKSWS